jgi:acyl-CoA reductase-like NAD-dependent aldehyde dehydrogenase
MATCAETLTPIVAECGGKDALIVDADADLAAAADAAIWGGIANAGQSCIGVERIYVHQDVYDRFELMLATRITDLRAGADSAAPVGPITMPAQVETIERHVRTAVMDGGRVVAGSRVVDGQVVQPILLADVPEEWAAVQEETFGPTLTIRKVRDMDEAVALTNASRYHLGASVFSHAQGDQIAARLRTGMVAVNSVFSFAVVASVPFGGVGDSGFGRIHGADGLREFCYAHAVVRQRFRPPIQLMSFKRTARDEERLGKVVALVHGRK